MSNLSLEVTLRGGDKKVFPLSFRASEYHQADSWHEFLIPCADHLGEIHLEMFTGDYAAWETISYHYLEGSTTTGDVEAEDFEADKGYKYAWQMLLDGKPATYAEVDQFLNSDFWLVNTSTASEGKGCTPLDKGLWSVDEEGNYCLDKSSPRLELADAIYDIADVGEDHYAKVLDLIEPILNRETEYLKFTVDGITYTFELSRCAEVSA